MEEFESLVFKNTSLWSKEYESEVLNVLSGWVDGGKRKPRSFYHIRNKYAIKSFAGVTKAVLQKDSRILACKDTVANIIKDIHESIGHKGERKTYQKVAENYANISRVLVTEYIKNCLRCVEKMKKKEITAGIVVKPILATYFNERGQVDLVDMQTLPDGNYKWIMHYQDHLSKYHFLRPLTSKTAKEVAENLLKIFVDFGAPSILQSDNGREFTANVIKVNINKNNLRNFCVFSRIPLHQTIFSLYRNIYVHRVLWQTCYCNK